MKRNTHGLGTRPLVEGALLAALAVALVLLGFYVPLLEPLVLFFWPVPITVIHLRHGLRAALLTLAVAVLALATFIGPLQALLTGSTLGLTGLAFGVSLRRGFKASITLLVAALTFVATTLIMLGVSFFVLGINPLEQLARVMQQSMEMSAGLYRGLGVDPGALEGAMRMAGQSLDLLRVAFPVLIILASLGHAFINYQVMRGVLRRLGYDPPSFPPFRHWRLPRYLALGFLAGFLFLAWQPGNPVAVNLYVFFSTVLLVQGLAVAYYFLGRLKLPRWLAVFLLVYGLMVPLLNQLVVWLGVADMIADYRRLASGEQGGSG